MKEEEEKNKENRRKLEAKTMWMELYNKNERRNMLLVEKVEYVIGEVGRICHWWIR